MLLRARELDRLEADLEEAVAVSRETARYAPARRRSRGTVDFYAEASAQIDLAIRNVRVLARGALRAARLGENLPPEIADAVRDLAAACSPCARRSPTRSAPTRCARPALHAAATATHVLEQTGNLSVTVVVGQVRSTAVDLLRGSGLTYDEGPALVREAAREVEGQDGSELDAARGRPRGRGGDRRDASDRLRRLPRFAPPGWRPPDARTAAELARMRARLAEPSTWAMLAEDGGLVAGHAGYVPQPGAPGSAHLWQLFVRPPWWGAGIAGRCSRGGRGGRGEGYRRMRLFTPRDQARARPSTSARASATPAGRLRGVDRPGTRRIRARAR